MSMHHRFFVSGGPDTNEEVHQRMHFHGYTRNNVDSYWHRDGELYRVYRISSTERTVVQTNVSGTCLRY